MTRKLNTKSKYRMVQNYSNVVQKIRKQSGASNPIEKKKTSSKGE